MQFAFNGRRDPRAATVIVDGASGRIYRLQLAVGYRCVYRGILCMNTSRDAGAADLCFPPSPELTFCFS